MVIPYWTDKFKSVNIFAMAIWGPLAEFNSCQYFQLYGILYTLSGMCVPRWKCFLASRLCLGTCHTWMQGSTPGAYNEMGTLHSSSTCELSWEWVLWVSEAQQLKYWFDDGPSQMGQLKKKQLGTSSLFVWVEKLRETYSVHFLLIVLDVSNARHVHLLTLLAVLLITILIKCMLVHVYCLVHNFLLSQPKVYNL